jgi:hypothetical protein
VFAYVDSLEPLGTKIEWESGTGATVLTALSAAITRIDYSGTAGAVLRVNGSPYTLSANPQTPKVPRILAMQRHQGSWTCSSFDEVTIKLSEPTTGVRARWTRNGHVSEYWVVPSGHDIQLGKVNCGGTTLPPSELDEGGRLELFAILPDGSEHPFADEHVQLSPEPAESRGDRRVALSFMLLLALFALVCAGVFAPSVAFTARRGGVSRAIARLPRAWVRRS